MVEVRDRVHGLDYTARAILAAKRKSIAIVSWREPTANDTEDCGAT